ncbi:MAG: SCO family protein [Gammaproteobacteria bacterium]|nr:SCO family protein [Gammaproteobacteria bacterium]
MLVKKLSPKGLVPVLLLSICVVIALYLMNRPTFQTPVGGDLQGVLRPEARELTAFTLIDQNNQSFELDRFDGRWSFVFFGYTYCPDICPTTLAKLVSVFSKLEKQGESSKSLNAFFVSVDPQRDKPEVLNGYMSYFNKAFIGVTGKKEQIDSFARQFGAGYVIEPEREPGDYLVSHTSSIFLVGPKKRLWAHFSPPHDAETIAEQFRKIKALY